MRDDDEPRWLSVEELPYHGGGVMGRRSTRRNRMIEWTDGDGQRVVIQGDRISVYGSASMSRRDGTVAIGADIPSTRKQDTTTPDDQGKFIQWVEEIVPEGNWQATKLVGRLRRGHHGGSYLGMMAEEYIQHTLGARDLDADVAAAKERIAAFLIQERP